MMNLKPYHALFVLLFFISLIISCNMPSTSVPQITEVMPVIVTETLVWSQLDTPTVPELSRVTELPGSSEIPTPTPTSSECLVLSSPAEGAVYNQEKAVIFTWEPVPGSSKYILEISNSIGWLLSIETTRTFYEVPPSLFPGAMQYSWSVKALAPGGQKICMSPSQTFSLAFNRPSPTSKPDNDDIGGPGNGDGGGGGGGDGGGN